jgi:hypothetical protein
MLWDGVEGRFPSGLDSFERPAVKVARSEIE